MNQLIIESMDVSFADSNNLQKLEHAFPMLTRRSQLKGKYSLHQRRTMDFSVEKTNALSEFP